MNILPLVSGFILLFTIGSYAYVHSLRCHVEEQIHYLAHSKIERELANKIQSKFYQAIPGKNLNSNEVTDKGHKKNIKYKSPRERLNPWNESKFNFCCLLKEKTPQLEQIAKDLIRRLYVMAPFYRPGLEDTLYEEIVRILQLDPNIASFEDIFPLVEAEKEIFYKIIKGTQNYTYATTKGIPPLGDFFYFDENRKKPIYFAFASFPVLQASLGDIIPSQILHEEKIKWDENHKHKPLIKSEFEDLLQKHQKAFGSYDFLFSFSHKRNKAPQYHFQDDTNHLHLKIDK